jgi:hypothetical protein
MVTVTSEVVSAGTRPGFMNGPITGAFRHSSAACAAGATPPRAATIDSIRTTDRDRMMTTSTSGEHNHSPTTMAAG